MRMRALAHPTIRRGIQSKYKEARVTRPEVKFTRRHLTLALNATIPIDKGRAPEVSGPLYIISKYWFCTRVSHVLLE